MHYTHSRFGARSHGSTLARLNQLKPTLRVQASIRLPVALFLIGLAVPWMFHLGSLRMSVYRSVLLLLFIPCVIAWLSGRAGRIRIADIALIAYLVMVTASISLANGSDVAVRTAGIVIIETLGPYLLARCYIRTADDFYSAVRFLFGMVLILLPFAAIELLSGFNISRTLFALVFPTFDFPPMPQRSGLTRVTSVFDHPILFGAFAGSIFALVYLVLGYHQSSVRRTTMTAIVGLTSMMSLSSGPLVALITQAFLLCWNGLFNAMKFRWTLLIAITLIASVFVELAANRSLLDIIVTIFLFDPGSYWFRKLIWLYGVASVEAFPYFGTGLGEWARPEWMGASIDNFWLFQAVNFGLPAAIFLMFAFGSVFLSVAIKRGLNARLSSYRTGFLIAMAAFFVVAWTVHFWDASYALLFFLMGSGVWLLDANSSNDTGLET